MIVDLIKKYKELILYGVFGVLTTVVNIAVYYVFTNFIGVNYLISNAFAWFLSVLFAYITNKLFVFNSKSFEAKGIIKEGIAFFGARAFSGVLDMTIMYIFVDLLTMNDFIVKIISNILVILINYFLSKYWIFKKDEETRGVE